MLNTQPRRLSGNTLATNLLFTYVSMNSLSFAAPPVASHSAAEQAARQREVDNALLVQALCERRPSAGVIARLMRYVSGELNREQAFAELYMGTY